MKSVYLFGDGKADGSAKDKNLLGGKGANLAEMTTLGIPVPPGFTISTDICCDYMKRDTFSHDLEYQVQSSLSHIENIMGQTFGDVNNPLLVFAFVLN